MKGVLVLLLALVGCSYTAPMPNADIQPSSDLHAALEKYREFLIADDVERSNVIGAADCETLGELVADVEPLFDEINDVLDRLVAARHPLPADLEDLEVDLNSLGQVGSEARYEIESRC